MRAPFPPSTILRPIKVPMAHPSASPLLEGVFAIHKPPSITSAQVIRDLQTAFLPSTLFTPLVEQARALRRKEGKSQNRRRKDQSLRLKIGHGGTLDPMATGVLIIGIGRGTKYLTDFLGCTKSYTCDVLFGAATDTYDRLGRILSRAPYGQVTRERVDGALGGFRGDIMQMPPIYSALKQDGKKLYEYAREGKEPPRAIEERPVTVESLEIVEWLDKHDYKFPDEEAGDQEKEVAGKILHLDEVKVEGVEQTGAKRKREDETQVKEEPQSKRQQGADLAETETKAEATAEDAKAEDIKAEDIKAEDIKTEDIKTEDVKTETETEAEVKPDDGPAKDVKLEEPKAETSSEDPLSTPPPAVTLSMTVTSGFYVRSLCHDLGKAVGSHGLMASLVRSRQGDYKLGENVFEYDDLAKGEEVWGPKLQAMLEGWLREHPK